MSVKLHLFAFSSKMQDTHLLQLGKEVDARQQTT